MGNALDQLADMATFACVVETQGFSRAARRLGLSKATVSKRVARLEDRLGTRLLNRTTRRLSLTESGSVFFEHCTRMVAEAVEAEAAVAGLAARPTGTLRVNAPMSFGRLHLGPLLPEFLSRYPELSVDIELDDRFLDIVDAGFDVAVRVADLPDSSLVARRVAPARRTVCGAPAYFARRGTPRTPDDLIGHNCLYYRYLATRGGWPFARAGREWRVPVSGSLSANNGELLISAALSGAGLVFVPTFMVGEHLRSGALVEVLREYSSGAPAVYALYPHRRHVSVKVRAFIDFLVEKFSPVPCWEDGSIP
jgi:DNA-binding transcriptional LysR family regulator